MSFLTRSPVKMRDTDFLYGFGYDKRLFALELEGSALRLSRTSDWCPKAMVIKPITVHARS